MKRFLALVTIVFAAVFIAVAPAAAQGIIIPEPGVFTDPSWLRIDFHRVNVTIDNQVATTNVDMQFTNQGDALAEGTFVFPLPAEAAVDQLIMYVDGQAIEAKILPADEARAIYDEIVRQYRDPALLEYIGSGAIQANIFPIPPGDSRRVEISYGQVLQADNGLIKYVYPLHSSANADRTIESMSISVDVTSNDPISTVYSPSHAIATSRTADDLSFRAGFESNNFTPGDDFTLYYAVANDTISVNLLTYRESATEDGFFMMLVQPPITVDESKVSPKDVIIVLDQSGSMEGVKWDQAREAANYVLENLNAQDRFNIIAFSTGIRVYSNAMERPDRAADAINWMQNMNANGGTDINLALTNALQMADVTRQTTVMFLTDGLATEGVIDTNAILENLRDQSDTRTRIFTFGVGDDVDTFLLDQIVMDFRGTGTYVRPTERIDEEVASLYNKISAPVLTDVVLDFGDVRAELLYPEQLPDLFAGEQLTLVGRYRGSMDDATIKLSGLLEGVEQTYSYDGLIFRDNAGGEPFIARLWATRRIGDLLNTIRLNGENDELVDSVVDLSVRYGIITPYTSFLIEEDDILTQQGREAVMDDFAENEARSLNENFTGSAAVDAADSIAGLNAADAPAQAALPTPLSTATPQSQSPQPPQPPAFSEEERLEYDGYDDEAEASQDAAGPGTQNQVVTVNTKTFININGVWNDTEFQPDTMTTTQVVFLSDEYFALLDEIPAIGEYFALGEQVIVVMEGVAYEVVPE